MKKTATKKRPAVVDQQMEFESAQLLLIALQPLSKMARARVLAFVNSQLEEMSGEGTVTVNWGSANPFIHRFYISPETDEDGDGDDE